MKCCAVLVKNGELSVPCNLRCAQRKACRVFNHSELLYEEGEKITQEAKDLENYLRAQKNNLEMWLKRGILEQQVSFTQGPPTVRYVVIHCIPFVSSISISPT